MFWNLPNAYAANFGRQRLGYLHANHFWNNFMNYSELDEFDYMMRIDDDSWFNRRLCDDIPSISLNLSLDQEDDLKIIKRTWFFC